MPAVSMFSRSRTSVFIGKEGVRPAELSYSSVTVHGRTATDGAASTLGTAGTSQPDPLPTFPRYRRKSTS